VYIHRKAIVVTGRVIADEWFTIDNEGVPGILMFSKIEYFDHEDYKYYKFSCNSVYKIGTVLIIRLYKSGNKRIHYLEKEFYQKLIIPLVLLIFGSFMFTFLTLIFIGIL
jgi:hypothetical protein